MQLDRDVNSPRGPVSGSIRRVLVVDDSRLQRRILGATLKKWGFEVLEADSGDAAIDICLKDYPDLVISDWMMPGMNGLEFCHEFRSLPTETYGYFILLTSRGEKDDIAEGLGAGADDFLTKPVNSSELRARISAGERILAMQRELLEKKSLISDTLGKLQDVYDSIDKDLIQAKKIQESLVPELTQSFENSTVSLLLKPCGHIGGDLVGMFSAGNNKVGFYSVDVSGHGITSAMMTARLGGYLSSSYFDQNVGMCKLREDVFEMRPPEGVGQLLNARLLADKGIEEYFTMAYAVADLKTGDVEFVQAGHPHPLVLRKNGQTEFVGEGGVPIGLLPDIPFSQYHLKLEDGDRLLLYSDGFTECRLKNGEMLEPEGLIDLIQKCQPNQDGQEFLDDLFWNLTQIMSPEFGMEDDVSATLFEFKPS
ncbi:MAG: PP2C family protein-serine/threonine phosphatase [Sedimentitalea sp.]